MNGKVVRGINIRNKAWERFERSPIYVTHSKYKSFRNKANKVIKKAKRNFEKKLADKIKTDPKSFYAYIKSKYKTKVSIGPLIKKKGQIVTRNDEMSHILNEYFSSVFTVEDLSKILQLSQGQTRIKVNICVI